MEFWWPIADSATTSIIVGYGTKLEHSKARPTVVAVPVRS